MKTNVWDRTGAHEMSKGLFAFLTSIWVLAGIGTSLAFSSVSSTWDLGLWAILGILASAVAGSVLALTSPNPGISVLGFAMVAIPFGILLGPFLNVFVAVDIIKIFFVTTGLVAILGAVGAMIPDSLEGLGSWVLGALVVLLLGQLAIPVAGFFGVPIETPLAIWDWVGVAVFCAIVVYDWNRAMKLPRTVANSIDAGLSIYLDWVNIFIRLLSRQGRGTRK